MLITSSLAGPKASCSYGAVKRSRSGPWHNEASGSSVRFLHRRSSGRHGKNLDTRPWWFSDSISMDSDAEAPGAERPAQEPKKTGSESKNLVQWTDKWGQDSDQMLRLNGSYSSTGSDFIGRVCACKEYTRGIRFRLMVLLSCTDPGKQTKQKFAVHKNIKR